MTWYALILFPILLLVNTLLMRYLGKPRIVRRSFRIRTRPSEDEVYNFLGMLETEARRQPIEFDWRKEGF